MSYHCVIFEASFSLVTLRPAARSYLAGNFDEAVDDGAFLGRRTGKNGGRAGGDCGDHSVGNVVGKMSSKKTSEMSFVSWGRSVLWEAGCDVPRSTVVAVRFATSSTVGSPSTSSKRTRRKRARRGGPA
mmetsp:Transcript_37905/g.88208  ORF Transcript_37905/g.88208 Transcript_37905/m.88208 type:complete len:129 (+) Transcript_37905:513-899(+)